MTECSKAAFKGSVTMNVTDIESLFQSRILQMLHLINSAYMEKLSQGWALSFLKIGCTACGLLALDQESNWSPQD